MHVFINETNKIMETIKQDLLKLGKSLNYVFDKVDDGCRLYEEDMPVEAEIAFSQAIQYSEELIESNPDNGSCLSVLAETHHIVSLGYSNNGEYNKATYHIEKALSLYESFQRKDRIYEMTLLSSKARIEVMADRHDKAIGILERIVNYYDKCCIEIFRLGDYVYCSDLLLLGHEYFLSGQYPKAVEVTKRAIQYKHKKKSVFSTQLFNDYLKLLHLATEKAEGRNDETFQQHVLEEGIATCRQEKDLAQKSCLCSLATFYQDIIKLMFYRNDKESLKRYYEELVSHCDKHIYEDPRLKIHKISAQLNYAVFCSIGRNDAEAEETVSEAIGGCMGLDDEGLEHTFFLFSALHTLANLKWQNGDREGALRELERESNILMTYLSKDLGKKPDLYLLLLDLIRNEVMLYNEIGLPERGETIIDAFKENIVDLSRGNDELGKAPYMAALKKVADIHWALKNLDQARNEYHEVLMILDELREYCPELAEPLCELEDEIRNTIDYQ